MDQGPQTGRLVWFVSGLVAPMNSRHLSTTFMHEVHYDIHEIHPFIEISMELSLITLSLSILPSSIQPATHRRRTTTHTGTERGRHEILRNPNAFPPFFVSYFLFPFLSFLCFTNAPPLPPTSTLRRSPPPRTY